MGALRLGAATVDPSARSITINGITHRASPKSIAVLNMLVEAAGDVVSRDMVLKRVWPDVCVGDEVLTQAIAELRRAFGDTPQNPQYIQTVPKTGYRLLQAPISDRVYEEPPVASHNNSEDLPLDSLLAYMTASDYLEQRGRKNIESAIELFRESISCAHSFSPAHAGLSIALAYRRNFYDQTENATQEALSSAQTAIRLDRTASEGYVALGYALSQIGELDHAVTSFNAALRLSMDSYYALTRLGRVLLLQNKYDFAARVFDRASNLRGEDPHALMLGAKACRSGGDHDGARARLKRALWRCDQRLEEIPDDPRTLICKAYSLIHTEGVGSAAPLIDRLINEERPFTYYLTGALAQAGEQSLALDRLEAIVDNGWADAAFMKSDRELDPLRREPRFQKIATALAA